jgi:antitoxin HicB
MTAFTYPARIVEESPGEFLVTFRDIPEAITGGATFEESYQLAADALDVAVEGLLLDTRDVPSPSPAEDGEVLVPLSPAVAARLMLVRAMDRQHVSGRALAERLGKDEKNVRRILQGKATVDAALEALRALGIRPALSIDGDRAAA